MDGRGGAARILFEQIGERSYGDVCNGIGEWGVESVESDDHSVLGIEMDDVR